MLFSQLQFWLFFAVVLTLYAVLRHRAQNRMLLVASYVFYGAWDWRFLGLILLSTGVDYLVALRMGREENDQRRRYLMLVSLVMNLGMLGFFKYFNFFADSLHDLLNSMGFQPSPLVLSIVLPVGISFYTFQTLSYTIDVYRRELQPTADFLDFALFVAFFPQLVAGPIERASNLLPEIANPRRVTSEAFGRGVVLCTTGLIKKIVIADGIAPSVDAIYHSAAPSGADILLATWLFAIQIYCDFSGYTDIARGVAKMLGFNLMLNFRQPYFATNPQEFWHRWHISLSSWLRDYLYISLGGNRKGRWKTYRNLMATMVLGGLWHGAAWHYVAWGAYQGLLLTLHRAFFGRHGSPLATVRDGFERPHVRWAGRLKRLVAIALFFQVVSYGWLLFRAESLGQVGQFTQSLMHIGVAQFSALSIPKLPVPTVLAIASLFLWDALIERLGPTFYAGWATTLRGALYAGMVYLLAFGATTTTSAFIYFQF